jgi:hypothetical protein
MVLRTVWIISFVILIWSCDTKNVNVSGRVVNKATGEGVKGCLVNYSQCKENGANCIEVVISQAYTNNSGDFIITKKTASQSRTKWITVFNDTKKLIQVDNVGLNDKNIQIEVTL